MASSVLTIQTFAPEVMSNRAAASDADRISRNDQCRRQLATLEFIRRRFDTIENIQYESTIESGRDNLIRRRLLLEVKSQYAIELVVGRQRLIVELFGRQFSRW